ncbi:uncharacterized protein BDZ99DRAFT_139564 [Mytilinidion resinicola]|uniref:Yeast cell wall synthesis Kre9/Knh1-like N-terminal domain-containing protein n=1 Tax=Mytilinidion resinicola TaxID=574789 RepID=A0A6A6Z667_9PEZI|nr:uncharacterized protein BDZ99DRAFT_139564 [Mytilinidion resinicola]KAF2816586.1 hypothetical protein BDZ99DRAFT_139564 [Mytilinidion resinicola]
MYARSVLAAFAGLAAMASAYTTPVFQSSGYAVRTPGLAEIVPVGTPYKITWDVTKPEQKTVTLVLLRGPSTNIKYLSTIVEDTPNTGSFEWTPSTSLEPDTTHYGIQLIVDADGEYQYTSQFGISNPSYGKSSSSSVASVSKTAYPSSSSAIVSAAATPCSTSSKAVVTPIYSANSTSAYITGTGTAYSTFVASTGAPHHNSSIIQPSKPLTVPSSLLTYTTAGSAPSSASPSVPVGTGAAGHVQAGLGLAGAIAGLVMVL